MTKHSRVSGDLRSRAGARLGCLLVAALSAGMLAGTAQAASHPARYAEAHEAVVHHVRTRRVQATPEGDAPKSSSSRKDKKAKARSGSAVQGPKSAQKPTLKSRRRKPRPQEADNDPLVVYRTGTQHRRSRRASRREIASVAGSRRMAGKTMASRPLAPEDFVRAEKSEPGEALAHGQSHPEDDERLPMRKDARITAEVSAAPEPVTPVGRTTLPQKLHHAAENVETAMKSHAVSAKNSLSGRRGGRGSVLPEDHAGKVDVIEQAMTPVILPTLYTRHGRLIVPPPMKGTRDILIHQNEMADSEGLDRIQDDDALDRLCALHLLVPLEDSAALWVNDALPENRRYARPWAVKFASDMARAYYARFRQPLHLSSAVRTVEYQLRLQRVNGNAAAVDGDGASPHLTGQALDFGKHGMSKTEIAWMRAYLGPLMQAGKVDVEEEFQQACFHISVYRSYAPAVRPKSAAKMEVARADTLAADDSKADAAEQ